MNDDFENYEDDEEFISKSQAKRDMEALQILAEKISKLNNSQLDKITMSETLRDAIEETRRISNHEALRRHYQFLGKLMRKEDHEAIQVATDRLDSSSEEFARFNQQIERWREQLIEQPKSLSNFIEQFPDTDIQHLRQLVRNAAKEQQSKPDQNTARKKLFQYIKDVCFTRHI